MVNKEVPLQLEGARARILYHEYRGFGVKTLLVPFHEERRTPRNGMVSVAQACALTRVLP